MLELPAYELQWWALSFSIDDDARDPKKYKKLLEKQQMYELSPEERKRRFREVMH